MLNVDHHYIGAGLIASQRDDLEREKHGPLIQEHHLHVMAVC